MGKLIDRYRKTDADFNIEFNLYLQELKSQNDQEKNGLHEMDPKKLQISSYRSLWIYHIRIYNDLLVFYA